MEEPDPEASGPAVYVRERARLLNCLGALTEGGAVEALRHVGSSSVPEMDGSGCIDVALSVWPLPLDSRQLEALAEIGYRPRPERASAHCFNHASGGCELLLMEAGSETWTELQVLRDYLRSVPEGRKRHEATRRDLVRAGLWADEGPHSARARLFEATLAEASAWWIAHHGFGPVLQACAELQSLPFPWCVAGGWSLDLYLGAPHRVHHDIDIEIPRAVALEVMNLLSGRGRKFVVPHEGRLEVWRPGTPVDRPRHQAHAHRAGAFLDFVLSESDSDAWRYRRDPRIHRPMDQAILRTDWNIPIIAPEIALLFKSRQGTAMRPKDLEDFERAWPRLEPERLAWLRSALELATPDHPWISRLASACDTP